MYIFNHKLFANLNSILGVTKKSLAQACNVAATTYQFHVSSGDMPLQTLINICNYTRVPISYFIVLSGEDKQYTKDELVIVDKPWIPIENNVKTLGRTVKLRKNLRAEHTSAMLGICTQVFYKYFEHDDDMWLKLKCSTFINMANNGHLYPGDFVIDNNRPIDVDNSSEHLDTNGEDTETYALQVALKYREENIRLKSRIRNLEAELKELKESMNRRKVDYRDVAMIDDVIDIAAEDMG